MFVLWLTKIMARAAFYWVFCNMISRRKFTAFFLAAIYLLPVTPVAEFLKFPQLVQHYFDHISENDQHSFTAFLFQHYFIEDGTDKDATEDSRLPFKSGDQLLTSGFVSVDPPQPVTVMPVITTGSEKKYTIHQDDRLPDQYPGTVWQPPRIS